MFVCVCVCCYAIMLSHIDVDYVTQIRSSEDNAEFAAHLFSSIEKPHKHEHVVSMNGKIVKIALLIPSRTPKQISKVTQMPLFTIFLPSFKKTIATLAQNKELRAASARIFTYSLYLGYDVGKNV